MYKGILLFRGWWYALNSQWKREGEGNVKECRHAGMQGPLMPEWPPFATFRCVRLLKVQGASSINFETSPIFPMSLSPHHAAGSFSQFSCDDHGNGFSEGNPLQEVMWQGFPITMFHGVMWKVEERNAFIPFSCFYGSSGPPFLFESHHDFIFWYLASTCSFALCSSIFP